jgi:hypothetical protein
MLNLLLNKIITGSLRIKCATNTRPSEQRFSNGGPQTTNGSLRFLSNVFISLSYFQRRSFLNGIASLFGDLLEQTETCIVIQQVTK